MYDSLSSQFFRNSTDRQSGQDMFEESKLGINIFTYLGVTRILYSFRLILEGRAEEEGPDSSILEFWERISANNRILSATKDGTSRTIYIGDMADLCSKSFCYYYIQT